MVMLEINDDREDNELAGVDKRAAAFSVPQSDDERRRSSILHRIVFSAEARIHDQCSGGDGG